MDESDLALPIIANPDHYCFGCGQQNPHGLHLTFLTNPDNGSVWTIWTPTRKHEGYAGIIHGGVVATILDEVMAWTLSAQDIWAVTVRSTTTYRRPVEVGVEIKASARVTASSSRKFKLASRIEQTANGLLLAEGTGEFIRVPEERAAEWRARYSAGDQ